MNKADLEAIKARLSVSTPGPWMADHSGERIGIWADGRRVFVGACSECQIIGGRKEAEFNASLIAHSPADIAALIAEVERLQLIIASYGESE